jgi:hypothetical protein
LQIEQWRGHGLISSDAYSAAVKDCNNFIGQPTAACNLALDTAAAEVGHINIYCGLLTCAQAAF